MSISFHLGVVNSLICWRKSDNWGFGGTTWLREPAVGAFTTWALLAAVCVCSADSATAQKPTESPMGQIRTADKHALPSRDLEQLVAEAFSATHDGWSADEVLLSDARRGKFVASCRALSELRSNEPLDEDAYCRALLHIRKAGGKLPRATQRAKSWTSDSATVPESELLAASEIAARQLSDQLHCHTDAILVDSKAREFFDIHASKICPASNYSLRKAALRLRKTRRLEPELLARVTDWKLQVAEHGVSDLQADLSLVPRRPGIYLFRDKSGYLYIGQASDLRTRLTSHLTESDRRALSDYLGRKDASEITVEVHVFLKGSPGERLRTRLAYESELIRTRAPRLNLAP